MYNQYIPQDQSYTWVEQPEPAAQPRSGAASALSGFLDGLHGFKGGEREKGILSTLLGSIHLEKLDTGDYLILAIAALLFVEGEDIDLAIALALVFLLGFGEEKQEP